MNTIDVVDYVPLLLKENPNALAIYVTLKHFCNKKGTTEISLAEVAENLSLELEDTKAACRKLQELGLITKGATGLLITMDPKRKASPTKLSLYAFGNSVPPGYEVLFSQQELYKCYTTNGNALWKVLAEVSRFLNLDYFVVRRLLENPIHKEKFIACRKQAEEAAEISGTKVTKRKLLKASGKTVSELTEQLLTEVHIRNEHEIPEEEWKAPQLLRLYCLEYKKKYQQDYTFGGNPFGSLEMKEMKNIHEAFDCDANQAIAFLKWCFEVKANDPGLKFPPTPRFCSHANVIREYKSRDQTKIVMASSVPKEERKTPLPQSLLDWIEQNYKDVQQIYQLTKMEDLVWMRKAYDENDLPHVDLKPIIEHAISTGVLK